MKNDETCLRLMQTRPLGHLWNSQQVDHSLSFEVLRNLITSAPVEVTFCKRESDQRTGKRQQLVVVNLSNHVVIELKTREFIFEREEDNALKLLSIGGIREVRGSMDYGVSYMKRRCVVELVDWHTLPDVCESEDGLIDAVDRLDVTYPILNNADVQLLRQHFDELLKSSADDEEREKIMRLIHSLNRITNPWKYGEG